MDDFDSLVAAQAALLTGLGGGKGPEILEMC
jgi:hypothetical protein